MDVNDNSLPTNKAEDTTWDMTPYAKMQKIGVLDPEGKNINPLNNLPYSENYKLSFKEDRHWSKLPFNTPEAQKMAFTAIQNNNVILVKSGTGSGKSSQVPKFVSHLLGYKGRIAITIPTQLSTENSARYMAKDMDVVLGEEVGFKFRGKNMMDINNKKSKIVFTTDGTILSQLLGTDPNLSNLNALILDEAHKRSANIDMILLLVKVLLTRRKDFKLIIISATINIKLFEDYFPKPEFSFATIEVTSNPPFPITQVWADVPLKTEADDYIPKAINRVMNILTTTTRGDILVFLPTEADLGKGCMMLEEKNTQGLSFCVEISGEIFRVLDDDEKTAITNMRNNTTKRKVIFSTAAAEESITIKNILFVVDSGLNMMSSYNPLKEANILDKTFVTKSSVKQRAGRTGRLEPGTAYHLYTKKQFEEFPEYDIPEIKKINVASILLRLVNLEFVGDYKKAMIFMDNLIEPPSREAMLSGANQLKTLGVFTKSDPKDMGELSVIGKAMANLNMEPGVARSLLLANAFFIRNKAVDMYALLEVTKGKGLSSLLMNTKDKKMKFEKLKKFSDSKGDYFTMLRIYYAYEKYKKSHSFEELKRWCNENLLRNYPLSQVRQTKFRILRVLMDTVMPNKQENKDLEEALKKEIPKEFKTDDAKLIHSIIEGEGKIRYAIVSNDNKYITEYPPEKTVASLSSETMGKPKKKIIYNDLMISDGTARFNTVLFV